MARHKKQVTKGEAEPEVGHGDLRTTQAEYPTYDKGCPKCHGPVITRQRLFSRDVENIEIRVCRCRMPGCDWEGRLMR